MSHGYLVSVETAAADVEDFEWLLSSGESIPAACARMGVHPRTVVRRYQRAGVPPPPGLWGAARRSGPPFSAPGAVTDARTPHNRG